VNTGIASSYTGMRGVNKARTVVGFYVDDNTALQLGAIVDSGGNETTITYPDANESYTVFEGVNDNGHMSGQWGDTGGIVHSFVYNPKNGKFKAIDDPFAASFTQAWGVNNSNLIAVTSDAGPYIYCPKESTCPFFTAKSIVLHPREVKAMPGKNVNHSSVKHPLPKGAALQ